MKLSFILLLAFTPFLVSAQKIVSNTTDKFNNSTIIKTSSEPLEKNLGVNQKIVYGYIYKKDLTVLNGLNFRFKHYAAISINKKDAAILLFSDGSKLTLPYNGDYKVYAAQEDIYFTVDVSVDELKKISENEVTDIRWETSKLNIDLAIKSKLRGSLKGVAKLLLENQ